MPWLVRGAMLVAGLLLVVAAGYSAEAEAAFKGGWPQVTWDGKALTAPGDGAALELAAEDQPLPLDPATARSEGLRIVYQTPAGTLEDRLEPFPTFAHCFRRTLSFTNAADRQRDLTGAELRVAFAASAQAPRWGAQSFAFVETAPGGPTLCAAYTSNEDEYSLQFDMAPKPLARHRTNSAWRLPPGGQAIIGTQYLWVVPGPLAQARRSAQDWYDAIGLKVPGGKLPWLVDCVMYQACAGGSVDAMFGDTGGFDNFARQLDTIADLGCNAFWLMAVTKHKDPQTPRGGWNLYGPLDYRQVDPAYGGDAALTRLTTAMRARGFRVLGEIVPHGGTAPQAASHPDWHTYDRNGEHSRSFGQAMDYSSPGWQETIGGTIRWLTAGWGFEGYRVDVAPGFGVNWKSATNGAHVSRSTMGGFLGMLRAINENTVAGGCRQPCIIPESAARPEAAPLAPVAYTWPLDVRLGEWFADSATPAELRQTLTDYFAQEQGSLPRGMAQLRSLNNHDTVVDHGRADRHYGVGLQRALTAVCTIVEGVPMIYQEQEVGSYDYSRRLFWARRRLPEMCRGEADYTGVRAPAEVFAVLRTLGGQRAVGLVNLSARPVAGKVTLPKGVIPAQGGTLYDAITGKQLTVKEPNFGWRLEPYGCAILRIGKRPEGALPAERQRPQSVAPAALTPGAFRLGGMSFQASATGGELRQAALPDGSRTVTFVAGAAGPSEVRLQVLGVDRWLVATTMGVYEDRLMRRHFPWPEAGGYKWDPTMVWGYEPYHLYRGVLPAGRVWQSAVAPLAAGGSIVFADAAGKAWRVTSVATNAQNVVLTDRSEEPNPEPYGLTLTFLGRDDKLNPQWHPGYLRSDWLEVPNPQTTPPDQPLAVTFTLQPAGDFASALAQAPPPVPPAAARIAVGPGPHHFGWERLWLIEPNTVAWSGMPLSQTGDYTLWVQLRHSEQGPEATELTPHYQITLDGKPVTFEWARLNVWRTGNGYFGWAKAQVGRLEAGPHDLQIRTTHTWCALQPQMIISRDPGFVAGL